MSVGSAIRARGRTRLLVRNLPRWGLLFAVTATMVGLLTVFTASFLQVYRLEREAARLERLKQELQEQNAVLREEVKLLYTPGYIERIAREQLGLVKPGEVALLIVQRPATPPSERLTFQPQPSWLARAHQWLMHRLAR